MGLCYSTSCRLNMKTGIIISPVNIEKRKELGIRPGDTVRVWQKIEEKEKTRLQVFEGLVLARKHGNEPGATFTVRRMVSGVGVEKVFPLYSPRIDKIEIVRRSKVRRAKLYYIREKVAREIRRQMRHMKRLDLSTGSDMEERVKRDEAEAAAPKLETKGEVVDKKEEVAEKESDSGEVSEEGEKKSETLTDEEVPVPKEEKAEEEKIA